MKLISIIKIFASLISMTLLMSISSCHAFEDCKRNYLMNGKVVDQSNNPIADVKIRWHYDDPAMPEAVLGYTDSSGNYSIPFPTRNVINGDSIEFVKAGFATTKAAEYTEAEAGRQRCGDINLVRDISLSP